MTSSLHKKRRTTRPSILHWMQDRISWSVGFGCALGISSLALAGDVPARKVTAPAGRASVDVLPVASKALVKGHKTTRTVYRVVRAQNEFEEPAIEDQPSVIPPPEPKVAPDGGVDPLKRLRDRSAKARWDQLHQEWLKNRKSREATTAPTPQQEPAAEPQAEPANPFELEAPANVPSIPGNTALPDTPGLEGGARRIPANPVLMQAQPSPRALPTDEELRKLLNQDGGERLPPPVRDPAGLPKIIEIEPNPAERTSPAGRPIPELDKERYVQLGNIPYVPRTYPEFTYAWEATNVWSNPLYFEDPTLERYGHSCPPCIQPIASVAKFGAQVVFLPYQMTLKPIGAKIYPTGWYSPGDYVPYRLHQPPLNRTAAAAQLATILGFSYALP